MALTQEDRERGARKGGLARAQKHRERIAMAERVYQVIESVPADQLPTLFTDSAAQVVRDLQAGGTPEVTSTADYLRMVEAADKLHKMGRLAAGQSTANTATLHMDAAERDARTAELRARLAAMDTPPLPSE